MVFVLHFPCSIASILFMLAVMTMVLLKVIIIMKTLMTMKITTLILNSNIDEYILFRFAFTRGRSSICLSG